MVIMEEIFEIRSCIEILTLMILKSTQLISMGPHVCSTDYKVYTLGDLHPLGGKSEGGKSED